MLSTASEIYFWSGIMRDHAEMFLTSLSSREQSFIREASCFKNAFSALRDDAKRLHESHNPCTDLSLVNRAFTLLCSFINYKRLAVRKLLKCEIELGLAPTFINHMINEAMEFNRVLNILQANVPINPVMKNIHLHKIWLPDASGHAAAVAAELDPTEAMLIKEAEEFKKAFDNLYIKAVELGQMLERACLENGSLQWLNTQVEKKIDEFICFLDKVRDLRKACKALGTLKPFIPDHMIREEKYYLAKIHRMSEVLKQLPQTCVQK